MSSIEFTSLNLIGEIQVRANAQTRDPFVVDPAAFDISFINPTYGGLIAEQQPPVQIDSAEYTNDTDSNGSFTFTTTKTFTATASATLTHGVTVGVSSSFQLALSKIASLSFGGSVSMNYSEANTNSVSSSQTFTQSFTIAVSPRTKVAAGFDVVPTKYTVPFNGKVQVRATLATNPMAHFRPGLVVQPVRHVGLGELFQDAPHQSVTPTADDTILVDIAGVVVGIVGSRIEFHPVQSSLRDGSVASLPTQSVSAI
jgi:hypothetical protein